VARNIQQASLPKEVPTLGGCQITPYYRPAREGLLRHANAARRRRSATISPVFSLKIRG
jgi:hypothetical protein